MIVVDTIIVHWNKLESFVVRILLWSLLDSMFFLLFVLPVRVSYASRLFTFFLF